MPLTHILVDFENTQPKADEVARAAGGERRLWIFRGPGQKKYDAEFAEALLALGEQARVVRCEKSGANALDMHIAFELGRLAAAQAPGAAAPAFIVVSKDTDYEPLLQYLRKLGFSARREKTLKSALGTHAAGAGEAGSEVKGTAGRGAGKEAGKDAGKDATKDAKPAGKAAEKASAAAPRAARQNAKPAAKQPAKTARQSDQQSDRQSEKQPAKQADKQADKPADRQAGKQATRRPARKAAKLSPAAAAAPVDHAGRAGAALAAHPKSRPVRLGALQAWLQARKVPEAEVDAVVEALQARQVLRLDGKKVLYPPFTQAADR
ncbi:MAG: PIN domain-containing protein [Betaproteobacteria bacterium]